MSYADDLLEPEEDENSQRCTGDPFTCSCEACQAFRIDMEADREPDEDQDAA
jgi:hypothetical protein